MRTTVGFLLGLVAGAALLAGVFRAVERSSDPVPSVARSPISPTGKPSSPGTAAPGASAASARDLFLLIRMADEHAWDELLVVDGRRVHALQLPAEVDRSTVPATDGDRIYAYVRGGGADTPARSGSGAGGVRLVAFSLDGREEEVVTDATPLVMPRGLFASPAGDTIAYFLDDRQTGSTELWAYDTRARVKRVVVERLTKTAVEGPFFSADGSFLLRHGEQILSGSPRRTGFDTLAVRLSLTTDWHGNVARSPDGARIAAVAEIGDDGAAVVRLEEYAIGQDGSHMRFSIARPSRRGRSDEAPLVNIHRWAPLDALILTTGTDPRVLWILSGEKRTSRDLGNGVQSPVVSSDDAVLGFLREGSGEENGTLETVDILTGHRRVVAEFDDSEAEPKDSRGIGGYRLLQYLRMPVSATAGPPRVSSLPASELLQYVLVNIRTLADAPPAEPVTPERAWFTTTPDTMYVDYRIGTMLWRRLVGVELQGSTLVGRVIGVFAPVGGEWILARGEDLEDRTLVALYEFEPDVSQWVEKPLVQGANP